MDERRSTARIADTVRSFSPEIVCFQEIHKRLPWSGREDQPDALARLLSRRFVFQCNVRFGRGAYGIGVAVRGDIVSSVEHLLPGEREQRGALEVRVQDIGGLRSLTLFCTHWGLSDEERLIQAEALAGIILNTSGPIILCGDFNEEPDRPAVQRLLSLTGLADAAGNLGRQEQTYPADAPTCRIDCCFYSEGLIPVNIEVGDSQASDHRPLVVDFI